MGNPKIVGIHGGKTISGNGAKPLPKQLISVRDNFRLKIQGALRRLFDGADDALFEMIDKAGCADDQALYFDAMRELRLQKRHIATTVVKNMLVDFNSMQHSNNKGSVKKESCLESLDLLDKDELEISVAVEAMVNRATNESGVALPELCKRLSSLLDIEPVELKSLPSSPASICRSFVDACECLEFGIRAKLIVLKLFERYVLSSLPETYKGINDQLRQAGVLPKLSLSGERKSTQQENKVENSQNNAPAVPVLSEDQYIPHGIPFNELRSLLHPGSASLEDNVVNAVPQSNVIQVLSFNQHSLPTNAPEQATGNKVDFKQLLVDSPQVKERGSLSNVDEDTISLISMLFDFILDDRQLQPVMKALIARLQIPILKVAMLDRSFFDRGGHPARKLLNEIATSALGWSEPAKGKADRLKDKIEEVVNKILKEFEQDISMFQPILEDFSKFITIENKRGKLIEQRTRDAENGKAANDLARKEVTNAVATIFADYQSRGHEIPQSIENFISCAWARVLNYTYLNGGPSSDNWKKQTRLVKDLVWTVCPDKTEFDIRGKLLKTIPRVMRECRAGLKQIMFDEFEANKLFVEIEKSHVSAMDKLQSYEEFEKKALDDDIVSELIQDTLEIENDFKRFKDTVGDQADVPEVTVAVVENEVEDAVVDEVEGNDSGGTKLGAFLEEECLVETPPDPQLSVFLRQVESLSIGTWFEYADANAKSRCKLAAHIKAIDKFIFVNRSGIKVLERTKQELAMMVQQGKLFVLNDGLLFDRALESVIGSLRGVN